MKNLQDAECIKALLNVAVTGNIEVKKFLWQKILKKISYVHPTLVEMNFFNFSANFSILIKRRVAYGV